MESSISAELNTLKKLYIVHIIILILVLVFNFITLSQIIWLKTIFSNLYFYATLTSPIHFILPIIALIFIFLKKIVKQNVNIFRIFALILCIISIIFGFYFCGVIMINAIESPEFCKECPFNLPIKDINKIIKSDNLNKKCNERRCAMNNKNLDINEKNENDYYEYLCNYNPTSEFDEIKETNDGINKNLNDTSNSSKDTIICIQVNKNDVVVSSFENNYVFNFYDKCNTYTDFYICERSQTPNKFALEDDYVCPEKSYMTKLVVYCLLNIFLNLMFNFLPTKLEYSKYISIINIYNPRTTNIKSNSFNSTLNSSEIPKEGQNVETEEKFVRTPTEILIICNNKNNFVNDKLTINSKNKETNINSINNINNINNDDDNNKKEIVIKKSKTKKITAIPPIAINKENIMNKLKSTKNIVNINNKINIIKQFENEKLDKKQKFRETENKISPSFDDTISVSTKREIIPKNKNNNYKDD